MFTAAEEIVGILDRHDEREAASAVLDEVRLAAAARRPQRLAWITRLCLRTGRPRSAVVCADALVALLPTARNMALLAEAHQRAGQYDASLETLERAAELEPESASLHAARAEALHVENRFDESIAAYERALSTEERPRWLSSLGKVLSRVGRDEEALAAFRRSQQLRPSDKTEEWIERLRIRGGDVDTGEVPRRTDNERMFLRLVAIVDSGAERIAERQLTEWLKRSEQRSAL